MLYLSYCLKKTDFKHLYCTKLVMNTEMKVFIIEHVYTGCGQNNGNTKKSRNTICVGYIERTLVDNTKCPPSICLHSIVLVSVH
jgi:hypothetical protein